MDYKEIMSCAKKHNITYGQAIEKLEEGCCEKEDKIKDKKTKELKVDKTTK